MKRSMQLFWVFTILLAMSLLSHAQKVQKVETDPSVKPITVEEAFQNGLIKLIVSAGPNIVHLEVQRISGQNDLKIYFPAGVTRLGFIEARTIKTGESKGRTIWGHDAQGQKQTVIELGGAGSTRTYRKEGIEFSLFGIITTENLAGDGFSLTIKQDTIVMLEKGKQYASVKVEGSLSLSVPSEYEPFFLAGLSGTIIEGSISIQPVIGPEKGKINIRYGNMKLKSSN